jgi:hypothetical protein
MLLKNKFVWMTSGQVIILCLALLPELSLAQTSTYSPYSRFGIGEIVPEGFCYQNGMGGIGAAIRSPFYINNINPASYVADTNTVFDFGARGDIRNLKSNNGTNTLGSATFSHFALAFPIKKQKISGSFGLLPFSSSGYNVVDNQKTDIDTSSIDEVQYEYQGKGGYHKLYFGVGMQISKRLSGGANISYLFGTIDQIKSVEFPDGQFYYGSRYVNGVTLRGFYINYGLMYDLGETKGLKWSAGLTGSISNKVAAQNNVFYYNYSISPISGGEIVKDSVINEQTSNGSIRLPQYIRGGLSVTKANSWLLGADFTYYDWSKYENFGTKDPLKNNYVASLGYERYLEKSAFRAGLKYGTSYVNLQNTELKEYGVTLGLSLKKSFSKRPPTFISFALEAGKRGTTENNLIEENYLKFSIGISMADIWFVRPRYE